MSITRPLGFLASAATAGLKPSGKPDLALIVCGEHAGAAAPSGHGILSRLSSAAVFTRNAVVGAPVEIGRRWRDRYAAGGAAASPLRAILVNAGCSNAATGQPGIDDARATMAAAARALGLHQAAHSAAQPEDLVLPSSTGIIGHRLPVAKITAAIPSLVASLARGERADAAAAQAIMTTDLVPKSAHRELELRGHQVHLGAIAKGSGMIAPQLDALGRPAPHATMLAFVTTDAAVHAPCLQEALEHAARESFDRISVDAHPSCSDTLVLLASGASGGKSATPVKPIFRDDPEFFGFQAALTALCQDLATQVVRDGEGATRTFRVEVRGLRTQGDAARVARAVVDSPLVKCAVHGRDPNWGRIVTAAGNAGVNFNPEDASLAIGGVEVYRAGVPTPIPRSDPALRRAMAADPVECVLTLGRGDGAAWMLGCDLSADYVRINAEYTT